MNGRQLKTLESVFQEPVKANIEWAAIESLLLAVGCALIEGNGSRVRFEREGVIGTFHRPEAKRYQVRDARKFLMAIGVRP